MRDLRQYWHEVNALQDSLPADVWLVPVKGGELVEVKASQAAKLVYAKTHRRATDDELAEYQSQQDDRRRRAFHEELRRKGIAVVPVSNPSR